MTQDLRLSVVPSFFISTLLLVLVTLALPSRTFAQTPTLDAEEQAFLKLINDYRAQNGAGPLKVSIALTNASKWMSSDMAAKNYFSHTDSLGRDPFVRMAAFTYGYNSYRGENIAAGFSDAVNTFNQWKNSPGHNQNMLNPNYQVIGIGRASGPSSTYGWYWTTDFGSYVDATLDAQPGVVHNVTTVNAANYSSTVAPDAIVVTFGSNLATSTLSATSLPLPTNLAGTTVTVNGIAAQLLYISPTQINYVLPSSVGSGTVSVNIKNQGVLVADGTITVDTLSPSIFTVTANGQGVPAGLTTFDGISFQPIANPDGTARPLSVGTDANPNYLVLFGTGIRRLSGLSGVQVTIGGVAAVVQYAGAQSNYAGLDQLNVKLPTSLRGRGDVSVILVVDGRVANAVRINIGG